MPLNAVITADIVNSTQLSKIQEKKLFNSLSTVLKPYKFEFFRGDSFQVYVKDAGAALHVLLQLRTAARKLVQENAQPFTDIKASIGIGTVRTPVRTLKFARGEAFILSGTLFDAMHVSDNRLIIQAADENANIGLKVISHFADFIFRQLTAKQAAVVFALLLNNTQAEIAKKLKKSQATISKHAHAAAWPEIERLLQDYKQLVDQL